MFNLGDRVKYDSRIKNRYTKLESPDGKVGTIVAIEYDEMCGLDYGVSFDSFERGHSCSGTLEDSSGFWCAESELSLVEDVSKCNM